MGLEDWRYSAIRLQLRARGVAWPLPSLVIVFFAQWAMVWLGKRCVRHTRTRGQTLT